MICTIFQNAWEKAPFYAPLEVCLARIKNGKSKSKVEEIRTCLDDNKRSGLKRSLPSVIFAGKFAGRGDKELQEHSGLLVLDFDKLDDVGVTIAEMASFPSCRAAWVSPSGNGVKALIRIADGRKHALHYAALKAKFPALDISGGNVERLCFESYDPHLYENTEAVPFAETLEEKTFQNKISLDSDKESFDKLLKWMTNKHEYFQGGNRNNFIFKLAGACCRLGIDVEAAESLIGAEFTSGNDFTHRELKQVVKSAFKSNFGKAGSFSFERVENITQLVHKKVKTVVKATDFTEDLEQTRDVVYSNDVKTQALALYDNGFESVKGIGVPEIDLRFKLKPGEVTALTGIPNMGKSAFIKWFILMRVILYGEKFVAFAPEDNPPEEYYLDFVEMLLGCDCTPANPNRPSREVYLAAYDWIGKYVFYLFPQDQSPTPTYVTEVFLEMILKEKVTGCIIDPWNQMSHQYHGLRSDQYLSQALHELMMFSRKNSVNTIIVVHPKSMNAVPGKDYPCPGMLDINEGAMWANKMDNILAYHQPFSVTQPNSAVSELHAKKIKRQKTVGKPGNTGDGLMYSRDARRYFVKNKFGGDIDPLADALKKLGLTFGNTPSPPASVPQQAYTAKPVEYLQKPENPFAGMGMKHVKDITQDDDGLPF